MYVTDINLNSKDPTRPSHNASFTLPSKTHENANSNEAAHKT